MMRRIHVKRVEPDPVGTVHESDVIEVDAGPLLMVLMRAGLGHKFAEDFVNTTRDAFATANPDKNIVVVCLDPDSDIELWEEVPE